MVNIRFSPAVSDSDYSLVLVSPEALYLEPTPIAQVRDALVGYSTDMLVHY